MSDVLSRLQKIIDEEIQPANAMQFSIAGYDGDKLRIRAPLSSNTNHHGTVFGGSQYAIGAVAGWALIRCKLSEYGLAGTIVVKSASMDYLRPVREDFSITVEFVEPDGLAESMRKYQAERTANLTVRGCIEQRGRDAAHYRGIYSIKNLGKPTIP